MGAGGEGEVRHCAWNWEWELKSRIENEEGGPRSTRSSQQERERERERKMREKERKRSGEREHPGRVVSRAAEVTCHSYSYFFLHLKRIDVIDPRFKTPISTRSGKKVL